MKIQNESPSGHLDVPLLAREGEPLDEHGDGCVSAGEILDVTEDHARILLQQRGVWSPADDEAKAVLEELDTAAADHEPDATVLVTAPYVPEEARIQLPAGEATAPPLSASKATWAAWAATHGDEDPQSKTKAQLIELYGPSEES